MSRESVEVSGYNDSSVAMEGTVATFSCPPRMILTGHNMTTCMGNGEWDPDPRHVKCIGEANYFLDSIIVSLLIFHYSIRIQLIVVSLLLIITLRYCTTPLWREQCSFSGVQTPPLLP